MTDVNELKRLLGSDADEFNRALEKADELSRAFGSEELKRFAAVTKEADELKRLFGSDADEFKRALDKTDELTRLLGGESEELKRFAAVTKESEALKRAFDNVDGLATKEAEHFRELLAPHPLKVPKLDFDQPQLDFRPIQVPTPKDTNAFQSARVLVKSMARTVEQWRAQLPANLQPTVVALLQGGVQINVSTLAEESFHGIRIEGTIDGTPCVVLAHQATVQLLCIAAKVEEDQPRRTIGFITDGQENRL